jgi:hypothetical protein
LLDVRVYPTEILYSATTFQAGQAGHNHAIYEYEVEDCFINGSSTSCRRLNAFTGKDGVSINPDDIAIVHNADHPTFVYVLVKLREDVMGVVAIEQVRTTAGNPNSIYYLQKNSNNV